MTVMETERLRLHEMDAEKKIYYLAKKQYAAEAAAAYLQSLSAEQS